MQSRTMELWLEPAVANGQTVTLAATLERPDAPERFRLWYRLPETFQSALPESADPFVMGCLFSAMRTGSRLAVHGQASPSLLRNLVEFQMAWTSWRPEMYRMVDIVADAERERVPAADDQAAVMAFSGGADSAFTAWRHRRDEIGRERCDLRAGVLIHGFDIPLDDESGFAGALRGSGAMLASLGMELFSMATNFRELEDYWEDAHGAGLASCLAALQGRYRMGLIAASYPYALLSLPYGSNPLTDVMLSSDAFRIVHDGAKYNRLDKLLPLTRWPEAMQHMRVCWEGIPRDRNCCRCQKCVSNMLYLRILGQRLPPCFPLDIGDREVARLPCHDDAMLVSMERLLKRARAACPGESWVRALHRCVLRNRLRLSRRTAWIFR